MKNTCNQCFPLMLENLVNLNANELDRQQSNNSPLPLNNGNYAVCHGVLV